MIAEDGVEMRKLQKENYFSGTRDICPRLSAEEFGGLGRDKTAAFAIK